MGQFDRLAKIRHAAALGASLKNAAGALDRRGQILAIGDCQPARLFAVDILSRFGRRDRCRRMPAITGGDQHGIDISPRE